MTSKTQHPFFLKYISWQLNYTVACPYIRRHVFEKETLNLVTGMKKEENLYLSDHSITCYFKKSETKMGEINIYQFLSEFSNFQT